MGVTPMATHTSDNIVRAERLFGRVPAMRFSERSLVGGVDEEKKKRGSREGGNSQVEQRREISEPRGNRLEPTARNIPGQGVSTSEWIGGEKSGLPREKKTNR